MARKYSKEFKSSVVNEICVKKRSTSKVAEKYKVPLKTVENWITLYNKDNTSFNVGKLSTSDRIKQLEKENAQLKKDNEILKKTMLLIAKDK